MPANLRAKPHRIMPVSMSYITQSVTDQEAKHAATKICATIGPATFSTEKLVQLLQAGVTSIRLDFTWGDYTFFKLVLQNLEQAKAETGIICAVMLETRGREIMVERPYTLDQYGWPRLSGTIPIKKDSTVTITTKQGVQATSEILPITYSDFPQMLKKGDTIYVGRYLVTGMEQGALFLEVQEIKEQDVICIARNSTELEGLLTVIHQERSDHKLENVQNKLPLLGERDVEYLTKLSKEFSIDFVSLSYLRNSKDIIGARQFLDQLGLSDTKIIAKIATRKALFNFQSILEESDGIICSRGNLGLDCIPQKMAIIQKNMVSMCNMIGKPVFITRIVDSMVRVPRPTRAEATDVANAVLDGIDGIILGAETVRGQFAVESVTTVLGICRQAELVFDHEGHFEHLAMEAQAIEEEGSYSLKIGYGTDAILEGASDEEMAPIGSMDRSLSHAISAMAHFGKHVDAKYDSELTTIEDTNQESKQESIASSAVRTASSICASLIVVFSSTGGTASLIAKYRPPMPIISLVVPQILSDKLEWQLKGENVARQSQALRGVIPMLATPRVSHMEMLQMSIKKVSKLGLVKAREYIVVVDRTIGHEYCIKILTVNDQADGLKEAEEEEDHTGLQALRARGLSEKQLRVALISTLSEIPQNLDIDKLTQVYKQLTLLEE